MYMKCVHCANSLPVSSSAQPFICSTCISCIFPFNHYHDDNEFHWSVFSYFHLNQNVNIDKIQNLRINPFLLNNDIHDNGIPFSETPFINDDDYDITPHSNCTYIFCEDFEKKLQVIHHVCP